MPLFTPSPLLRRLSLLTGLVLLGSEAQAGDVELYGRAIDRVRRHYLFIDQLDVADALHEAAESAEGRVPWLLVDRAGDRLVLRHGERGFVGEVSLAGVGVPQAVDRLVAIEDTILAAADASSPVTEELAPALLKGFSKAMDRHSVLLSGQGLARFDERISGRIEGIGARIGLVDGAARIKQIFPGGPADQGGLELGDRLLRVDGAPVQGLSTRDVLGKVRGEEGTQVVLLVERAGLEDPLELVLTRAKVAVPNVSWERLPSGVGLVRISHFSEQTTVLLRQALSELRGEPGLQGYVLDLRSNSGGSMIQSCTAADLFLGDGPVLRTEGREGKPVERLIPVYRARTDVDDGLDLPVVVLQGPRSASAAEILAGALMLRGRAVLIGQRSHGKGTVQKVYSLRRDGDDGRVSFKITVARYLLPGDVPIEAGVGLVPDLELRGVRFDWGGVSLPVDESEALVELQWADEQPGWRDQGLAEDRGDLLTQLAEKVILGARGSHRLDLLESVEAVAQSDGVLEEERVVQTLRHRGIDWTPADEDGGMPEVRVSLEVVDPPTAGSTVELRAEVENLGSAPLYRTVVALDSGDRGLPWSGLTLPVGFLPPGESGLGRAYVAIPADELAREDEVQVQVHADRRPPVSVEPALLEIGARPAPPVALGVRFVPGSQGDALHFQVHNRGARAIEAVDLALRLSDTGLLELSDDSLEGGPVGPGETAELTVPVQWPEGVLPQDVAARVSVRADGWGRIARFPVVLSPDGRTQELVPPALEAQVPLRQPVGPASIRVLVRDDREVRSVRAWYDGDQRVWRSPGASAAEITVPFDVVPGGSALVVEAEDDQGLTTRSRWWIRGVDGAGALVEGDGPEPLPTLGPEPEAD
jgi:carboxyl-terminal processing protease